MALKTYWMGTAAVALCIAMANGAHAQNADLDQIIVTASKRNLSLQETDGQAVIASPDDLARTNILNLNQLGQVFGDLTIRQRGNRAYDSVTLRGQSSVDFYNPTVQIYVDGVPQDQATFGQLLPLGIQQVEVLYGPQGTLYGRGAIGGVINVVTAPPGGTGFQGQALWGERTRDISALGEIALAPDTLFADVAFGYQDRDGEYRAFSDGSRLGDSQTRQGRARLRFAPDGGPFTAMASYSRSVTHSTEEQYVQAADFDTRTAYPLENRYRLAHDVASLTLGYDLGDARLSSITSYQARDYNRLVLGIASPETQKMLMQELRIASTGKRRLSYVAGVYYEHTDFTFGRPDFAQTVGQALQSFAVFGEATWAITDRLDVTGGARVDYHKVEARATTPTDNLANEGDFTGFSPKLSVGYRLNDQTRLYALASSGFKAGGFTRFVTPTTINFSYDPEKVLNGEIGIRTQGLDGRLGLTMAAYLTRNRDYQYYFGFQPNQYLANVGDVESKGLEGRLDLRPGHGWAVDATLSYNEAKFTTYTNPENPDVDLTGATLPYAPRWTGRLSIAKSIELPSGLGQLRAQGGATWSSRYYFDETNSFGQDGYTLYDATLSWEPDERWAIDLVVNNLTDKTYAPYGVALAPGMNFYQLAASREASLRVRARF